MALPKLILFPGLGADERLFHPQRQLPIDLYIPPRIQPTSQKETLSHYAARIAATLPTHHPFHLGGVSFGGMLAIEIARHLTPQHQCPGIILISSCRSNQSLPWLARTLAPFLRYFPTLAVGLAKSFPIPIQTLFGAATNEQVQLFQTMLHDTSPSFLHWSMCQAATWTGSPLIQLPIHQIHGRKDHVIPCPVHNTKIIENAGHLLNLTHPAEVNQFILDILQPD